MIVPDGHLISVIVFGDLINRAVCSRIVLIYQKWKRNLPYSALGLGIYSSC